MYKMRGLLWPGRSCGAGLIALVALIIIIFWPVKAGVRRTMGKPVVCACCAEEGEWYERSERITETQLHEFNRVRFSTTASTYQSPADDTELSLNYTLAHSRNGRRWELRFRDERGKTGTLSFMLPATAIAYGADVQDRPAGGVGPSLYKEWRFNGAARVTVCSKRGSLARRGFGSSCRGGETGASRRRTSRTGYCRFPARASPTPSMAR